MSRKKKAKQMFEKNEYRSMDGENLMGKVLVLDMNSIREDMRTKENALWKAIGGFGCNPNTRGTCVYTVNIHTGQSARWERYDFIGIYESAEVASTCSRT